MFKLFVFAVACLASAAAAPGYLGAPLAAAPLAHGPLLGGLAAPAISYGHALSAPGISIAHAPTITRLAAPAYAPLGLAPRISYASPAIAHAPLAAPLASPLGLGLGYRSIAAPTLLGPGLGHPW